MLKLARWCIAHRRRVIVSWVVIAAAATALASAAGRNYSTNFTLPGTETQRVSDLLTREFPSQSGDIDTIVFQTSSGSVRDPAVRAVIEPLLAKVAQMPHVAAVISPYSPSGGLQVSRDGRTAFASVAYDKRANLLPDTTAKPLIADVQATKLPGLKVAAGGQVVEQAEGFNIGPATEIGVVAALVILLLTFGSLLAAGMPLVTAGIGLITGVALIGLATHLMSMSNVAPQLALMIGLGVGIDYALFIVTRFREEYARTGDVERSVLIAMNTSGRAILLAGTTVMIALLGMFALGVSFMYGLATASVLAVLLTMMTSLTVLPALLSKFGARVGARQRRQATDESGRPRSAWRRWSETVQARPWPLAFASLALIVVLMVPVVALRMENSDAGNDPPAKTSRQAFDLLASGFGAGFNGPLLITAQLHSPAQLAGLAAVRSAVAVDPGCGRRGPAAAEPLGSGGGAAGLPHHGGPGAGHDRSGQPPAQQGAAAVCAPDRNDVARGRLHGRLDRLLARAVQQAAGVHCRGRGPFGAAAARDLPLAGDPRTGGGDEPAQHRRGPRGHGRRVPVGLARRAVRAREGSDRAVDPRAHVRRRLRPVDGLRGVPHLPRARGVGQRQPAPGRPSPTASPSPDA